MNRKDLRALVQKVILEQTREQHFEAIDAKIERIKEKMEAIENSIDVPEPSGYDSEPQTYEELLAIQLDNNLNSSDPKLKNKAKTYQELKNSLEKLESEKERQNPLQFSREKMTLVPRSSKGSREKELARRIRAGENPPNATGRAHRIAKRRGDIKEALKPIIKRSLREAYLLEEEAEAPNVEFPDWLENKIKTVHGEPGQGSIFSNPESVKNIVLKLIKEKQNEIADIANTTGVLKTNVANIGYDLVLPTEKANNLPDANIGTTEKVEGPNKIKVPLVQTSAPLSKFETNELTVIVRPKKDSSGTVIPNEYIILSAFPGKDLPRASEWNGQYSIIKPNESSTSSIQESLNHSRWQKLAGIIRG